MDKKRMANNILEFLVDPTRIPVERRIYQRPEELLDNRSFEKAKLEAVQAYGDQRHNSDMYPLRNRSLTQREVSGMDRKDIIATMDVLSQEFIENDPIAKDLRTMAYAVSKMADDDFQKRVAKKQEKTAANPWMEHMKKVRKDNPGKSVKELIGIAKKTYKKASEDEVTEEEIRLAEQILAEDTPEPILEDKWNKAATDAVRANLLSEMGVEAAFAKKSEEVAEEATEKSAGKIKGPGKPDGTGPMSGTDACPLSKKEEKKEAGEEKAEKMEEKAQEKIQKADELLDEAKEEEKKEAGSVRGPGNPDGTGPHGRGMGPGGGKGDGTGLKKVQEAKEAEDSEKKAEESKESEVNTDILSSVEFDGIELTNPMASADFDMDENEKNELGQLFRNAEQESLTADERSKLDQLFK